MSQPFIDVCGSLALSSALQVVILQGQHQGRWVDCRMLRLAGGRYDVLVQPTTDYDHAVGFSNREARRISREFLRLKHAFPEV